MTWDFSKPIPEELRDETPFNCPKCNHEMYILDENFRVNVVNVIFGD
jgi:transcription elongation factor Elf1